MSYARNGGRQLSIEALERRDLLTVVSLGPTKDSTIYESLDGLTANGAGQHLFAGRTAQQGGASIRRGLLAFDVASAVPAGATINSVSLQLHVSRSVSGPTDVALHRVLGDWGEGVSDPPGQEGRGAPASAGDASWLHTFFPNLRWNQSGGDFQSVGSAAASVAGPGFYTWNAALSMIADVAAWLESPSQNFGWILIGEESADTTAKRFDSRENATAANRPLLTIDFTEPVILPSVSITDAVRGEGDSGTTPFLFDVSLSAPSDDEVSVVVQTRDGTAESGLDYEPLGPLTLSFAPGETQKTVAVNVLGDGVVEADETFFVDLVDPQGATLARSTATGTVEDDDATLLTINDVTALEGDAGVTPFAFTVRLTNASALPITVEVNARNGTAMAGEDFTPIADALLTFAPGETAKTVVVEVRGDQQLEADETFFVELSNADGAGIDRAEGRGLILDDDLSPASLSGAVYGDTNNNGRREIDEIGIVGVTIRLTGVTVMGESVDRVQTTDQIGRYRFDGLTPGVYSLIESHPAMYLDGQDTLGPADQGPLTGVVSNDRFDQLRLEFGVSVTGADFAERGLRPEFIFKRSFHSTTSEPSRDAVQLPDDLHAAATTERWIASLYADTLGRPAAAAELGWWSDAVAAGMQANDVVQTLLASDEHRGLVVEGFYLQYLGRASVSEEIAYWLEVWTRQGGPEGVQLGMLASNEYRASHGESDEALITGWYQDILGRDASDGELAYWRDVLAESDRSAVVERMLGSDEYRAGLVAGWYEAYLDRTAEPAEVQYWVGRMQRGASQSRIQTNFLTSVEYSHFSAWIEPG